MKLVPSIVALAGALVLSACSDDDERMAENAYRDSASSTSTYPDTAPSAPSTTPTYPSPDPTTIPPTVNPESPTNPDGAFPPTVPPETTPPT